MKSKYWFYLMLALIFATVLAAFVAQGGGAKSYVEPAVKSTGCTFADFGADGLPKNGRVIDVDDLHTRHMECRPANTSADVPLKVATSSVQKEIQIPTLIAATLVPTNLPAEISVTIVATESATQIATQATEQVATQAPTQAPTEATVCETKNKNDDKKPGENTCDGNAGGGNG